MKPIKLYNLWAPLLMWTVIIASVSTGLYLARGGHLPHRGIVIMHAR